MTLGNLTCDVCGRPASHGGKTFVQKTPRPGDHFMLFDRLGMPRVRCDAHPTASFFVYLDGGVKTTRPEIAAGGAETYPEEVVAW